MSRLIDLCCIKYVDESLQKQKLAAWRSSTSNPSEKLFLETCDAITKGQEIKLDSSLLASEFGFYLVIFAAQYGHVDCLKQIQAINPTLLHKKCEHFNQSPLLYACGKGALTAVVWLVAQGAGIEEVSNDAITPLLNASAHNRFQTAAWLLSKGADMHKKTDDGMRPLMHAAKLGGVELADLLWEKIQNDPNASNSMLNAKNNRGETALSIATDSQQPQMMEWLLAKGATVCDKAHEHRSPRMGR